MTEREAFIAHKEREFKTTIRVLKAFPQGKLHFKPHERSRTIGSLAYGFVGEEKLAITALDGDIDFSKVNFSDVPETMEEIVEAYEKAHSHSVGKLRDASDEQFEREVGFAGRKLRAQDVMWIMMFDTIHHRGQLSVYLRLAGGKVPSIYGPSADEPLNEGGAAA